MPNIDFNPLPEQEQSLLLKAMKDILSSGRIPQDVSNELIMVAILEMNGSLRRTRNQSRRNAFAIRVLSLGIFLMLVTMVATYNDQFGILAALAKLI